VPIFLERFLLYLAAGAFLGSVIYNGMGLDVHQRIGLGIALVGTAYFLGHTAYKPKATPATQIQSARTTAEAPKPEPSKSEPAESPNLNRIFLPADIDPAYLRSLYKDNTALQAAALASPYLGKWMIISGSVSDIEKDYGGNFIISIDHNQITMLLRFTPRWAEQVSVLKRGSKIRATGKLDFINSHGVALRDCEF
jgi:tRNA_anti-like